MVAGIVVQQVGVVELESIVAWVVKWVERVELIAYLVAFLLVQLRMWSVVMVSATVFAFVLVLIQCFDIALQLLAFGNQVQQLSFVDFLRVLMKCEPRYRYIFLQAQLSVKDLKRFRWHIGLVQLAHLSCSNSGLFLVLYTHRLKALPFR